MEETTDAILLFAAVLLGGAISFLTTYGMARRAERAAAHASARILRNDLWEARAMLESAQEKHEWWPDGFLLPLESWRSDPRAPLALKLTDQEMVDLSNAFQEMASTNQIHAEQVGLYRLRESLTPHGRVLAKAGHTLAVPSLPIETDGERARLEMNHAAVMKALEVLSRFRQGGAG
jgi:hypothetical protein